MKAPAETPTQFGDRIESHEPEARLDIMERRQAKALADRDHRFYRTSPFRITIVPPEEAEQVAV